MSDISRGGEAREESLVATSGAARQRAQVSRRKPRPRRIVAMTLLSGVLVLCVPPASATPASATHPTPAERKFLRAVHAMNLFPDATDAQLLRSARAFCADAKGVGFTQAYLDGQNASFTDEEAAGFFLIDHYAKKFFCPKIKE